LRIEKAQWQLDLFGIINPVLCYFELLDFCDDASNIRESLALEVIFVIDYFCRNYPEGVSLWQIPLASAG
jgi:hypothetical protein